MILFSVCSPVLLGLVAAATDYARLVSTTAQLQQVVDAAALLGANELVVANMTDEQINGSVRAAVHAAAYSLTLNASVDSSVTSGRAVRVKASISMPFMFSGLLGLASQTVIRSATASLQGETQLCVLTLDSTDGGALALTAQARLTAPQCSANSNSNNSSGLQSTGSAFLQSSKTCTVGGYSGNTANYAPMPKTGCPVHPDPLKAVVPPSPDLTNCTKNLTVNADQTLSPGTYCGGITVNSVANVTLSPGVYIINGGDFHLTGSSQLHGQNVAIYFNGTTGTFKADPKTTLDLTAPKTGSLAGFLIYEDPTATKGQNFQISSTQAHNLLGTIYLPQGKLTIDAAGQVAEQSAYTVIVAYMLAVNGSANLTLNAMYSSTDVPVPNGVGPHGATVALTQ